MLILLMLNKKVWTFAILPVCVGVIFGPEGGAVQDETFLVAYFQALFLTNLDFNWP